MVKRKLLQQILILALVVILFACFNLSIYVLITSRLSNNFGNANEAKMVDVKSFLPFVESSNLARIDTDFALEGELPILDGAAALLPIYASVIDNVYPRDSVKYEGGVFSDDNYYGENFALDSKMQYKNTVRGYTAIVDGDTDILFCASPSKEQENYAKEKGVELVYVPIGLEAFVFFVNSKNPIDNLSVEEIKAIYSGEITNWKKVGGANRLINPVSRLEGSGSQTTMEKFMGNKKIANKSLLSILGGSIGFSFRYYMQDMVANSGVKTISVNGVYPDRENIKNGKYPIIAKFYAIYRADNQNKNVKILVDWLLSSEGQQIIEKCGYVAIN